MKLKFVTTIAAAFFTSIIAMSAADKPAVTANATNRFTISGMHCDGCAGGLAAELKQTAGVATAQVTFSNKLAVVSYDTNKITTTKLTAVIKEAGFEAKPIQP